MPRARPPPPRRARPSAGAHGRGPPSSRARFSPIGAGRETATASAAAPDHRGQRVHLARLGRVLLSLLCRGGSGNHDVRTRPLSWLGSPAVSAKPRVFGAALLHVPHPHGRADATARVGVHPGAVLATICAVVFLVGVNTTAINTALTSIADDLAMGAGEGGWTVGIYMLATAAFVVPGGKLGDVLGQLPVLVIGLVIFGVSSVLVAVADSAPLAIAGRFGQGAGAALLMPATMAALRQAYPPERQGFALGIWGAAGGIAFAFGPLVGGVVTDALDWRWIWWGTAALCAVVAWVARSTLRGMRRPTERAPLDLPGAALLAVVLFAIVLAVQQGPEWGWGSLGTLASFAVGAAGLVGLVALETRRADPLLNLRLLRVPAMAAANLVTFVNACGAFGTLYFFNLYAQAVSPSTTPRPPRASPCCPTASAWSPRRWGAAGSVTGSAFAGRSPRGSC
ncbi:MAG: MFS transporter [Solirubrobacterales bacterium]|nr:MFS transporter [Solirubrobacterales bacterium]